MTNPCTSTTTDLQRPEPCTESPVPNDTPKSLDGNYTMNDMSISVWLLLPLPCTGNCKFLGFRIYSLFANPGFGSLQSCKSVEFSSTVFVSNNVQVAIMLNTKEMVMPQPLILLPGQEFTFTIRRGVGTTDCVSVNYDDFVNDVDAGNMLLVDVVKCKDEDLVKCEVVDGSELKSRRHLNVRGKSATLQSITGKDWDDIKFGVDNKIDFYAVSLVKDDEVMHELKAYLKILCCSLQAMVARGDLGAELPVDEVPSLQIIRLCRSMGKAFIVATNIWVLGIAIAVKEGSDAVILSGETAHGNCCSCLCIIHLIVFSTKNSYIHFLKAPVKTRLLHISLELAFFLSLLSSIFTQYTFSLISYDSPSIEHFCSQIQATIKVVVMIIFSIYLRTMHLFSILCSLFVHFVSPFSKIFAVMLHLHLWRFIKKFNEKARTIKN
ncbi:hypothetical protein DCAR_0521029 [Daucus carota subsp. sativus]|uniref:pyruvate kinase n=1 Tax=Daucus carota subsp. sativus TaxID=79200 RepID=A0AAF0X797_DAUCS|nr:hypothetical protein DCAR_0521029 [Daucus carota subsp. sativus]